MSVLYLIVCMCIMWQCLCFRFYDFTSESYLLIQCMFRVTKVIGISLCISEVTIIVFLLPIFCSQKVFEISLYCSECLLTVFAIEQNNTCYNNIIFIVYITTLNACYKHEFTVYFMWQFLFLLPLFVLKNVFEISLFISCDNCFFLLPWFC